MPPFLRNNPPGPRRVFCSKVQPPKRIPVCTPAPPARPRRRRSTRSPDEWVRQPLQMGRSGSALLVKTASVMTTACLSKTPPCPSHGCHLYFPPGASQSPWAPRYKGHEMARKSFWPPFQKVASPAATRVTRRSNREGERETNGETRRRACENEGGEVMGIDSRVLFLQCFFLPDLHLAPVFSCCVVSTCQHLASTQAFGRRT